MEHHDKLCAVVVLSYQGIDQLRQFLPTLRAHSQVPAGWQLHLWVVDNASTDGTWQLLEQDFADFRRYRVPVNHGFVGGYVASLPHILQESAPDVYCLINADVAVTDHWLVPVLRRLADERIGAVQPKILSHAQPTHFEYSGAAGGYVDRWGYPFCRGRLFFTTEPDQGQYNDARPVFWASGACLFIRTDLYHRLGGLEPLFYAHMEEIDLCWRLHRSGYQVWVEPQSVVYHVGGHHIGYGSPTKLFYNYRNNLAMLYRNLPRHHRWGVLLVRLVLDGVAALRGLLGGRPQEFMAVLRAHLAFWRGLARWRHSRRLARHHIMALTAGLEHRARLAPYSVVWQYFAQRRQHYSQLPRHGH